MVFDFSFLQKINLYFLHSENTIMKYRICFTLSILILLAGHSSAQEKNPEKLPPGLSSIKQNELKEDLYKLAGDEMKGRRAGTINELNAAAWVAQRAIDAGLKPAGDNGTYFQFFSLYRKSVAENSEVSINGEHATLWKDVWPVTPTEARLDDSVKWLESYADTINDISQKVVAMKLQPPKELPAEGMSLWVYRYALSAIRQQTSILKRQHVKAIILVADSTASSKIGFFGHGMEEGKYMLEAEEKNAENDLPVYLVAENLENSLKADNVSFHADIKINTYTYPSANVVAVAPGTDSELKNEYVLFSGHHDHDGIGEPVDNDSIWNGADDNASVSVALLAIGRAWVKNPGKRSALFVWHGAEERGLMGSRYFVQNPTLEKQNIVAVLNGDMIGRNAEGKAALLGTIPPHRNSAELVNMAMNANKEITNFEIDTSWDAEDHPEFWYFRSDHLPYARSAIPSIFFTTLLHPDYHTPKDEADKIDLKKLTEMTKWMFATGWKVSQTKNRPALDSNNETK